MKLHEHQAKELLSHYQVPVPKGGVAYHIEEAVSIAKRLSLPCVVKAQIYAGGRGKGGGVKLAQTLDDVKGRASEILGMTLVTPQTGPSGKKVLRLLIEEGVKIESELYVSFTLDRATSKTVLMVSPAGGMEIEEVAAKSPEKIFKIWIDPYVGLKSYQSLFLSEKLGLHKEVTKQWVDILAKLYRFYNDYDCSLLEINPFVLTAEKQLILLDAKVTLDDNAMFRHADVASLQDPSEESEGERKAKEFDLSYISLDGNIGCMVNGAGLAMATMDIIKYEGGAPANFLDVGGGATAEKVKAAFKIILEDPKVRAILVNIFGGIMKCDVIAEGIVEAAREVHLSVPLVVRLEGTNVAQGKAILQQSGLAITAANSLGDAAKKVVKLIA